MYAPVAAPTSGLIMQILPSVSHNQPQASIHQDPAHSQINWADFDIPAGEDFSSPSRSPTPSPADVPSFEVASEMLQRFTRDHKMLHQVASLAQLEYDARRVYSPRGLSDPHYAASRFRVFLILYLAGQGILGYHVYDPFVREGLRLRAMTEVPALLAREDLVRCPGFE